MRSALADIGTRRLRRLAILPLATLALLTACGGGGGGDATVSQELAKDLQSQVDEDQALYGVPAISEAVVLPNGSVWAGASGTAVTKSGREVNTDTAFAIGSVTKTFVSALVLKLAEEGKLSLDDRVDKWVPEFPRSKGSSASLRQLLSHRSGIYEFSDNPAFETAIENGRLPWTAKRTLQYVKAPYFRPGKGFHYSNTNYTLLGMVIERTTDRPLSEQIRTRLLEPLGLERIRLQAGSPAFADIAHGYTALNASPAQGRFGRDVSDGTSFVPNAKKSQAAWAAGGMAADARSLAVWADALFGGQVLKRASLKKMIDLRETGEAFFDYGLGVMGAARPPWTEMVGHAGQIDGFQSEMWYLPNEDVTIVVLVNNDTFRLSRIVDDMLSVVIPQVHAASEREQ